MEKEYAEDGFTEEKGACSHGGKECCQKTKERSDKEYRDLVNRLNRIEGQVRMWFAKSTLLKLFSAAFTADTCTRISVQ